MLLPNDFVAPLDFLFLKCLSEKQCKRHVNMKTAKNIFGESHREARNEVVNAFDLDEISFHIGVSFNEVGDSAAKLNRMELTKSFKWEDKENNDETYLWMLSDKGKKYLLENESEKKIDLKKKEYFEFDSNNPAYDELEETKYANLSNLKGLAADVHDRIMDLMFRSDTATQGVWTQMFIRMLTKILKDSGYTEQQINNIVMDAVLTDAPDTEKFKKK